MDKSLDVVVVGGGHAGLGIGYFLKRERLKYVVLEQGRIGETWRTQRWDSFKLNTPNRLNTLPGMPYDGDAADGFWSSEELVRYFESYADTQELEIRTGITVTAVDRAQDGDGFTVRTRNAEGQDLMLETRNVVVATGIQNIPRIPALHGHLPKGIRQLHTAEYRSPAALPGGAVVVVGSGQSGCQIVEDLLAAGRTVFLCTSKVGRAPRRYRGRDVLEWWLETGFWNQTPDQLEDPGILNLRQPQISGIGRYGHTVSLQQLARDGAVILGRLSSVRDQFLIFAEDAAEHVAFGDALSAKVKGDIDKYLDRIGIDAPREPDPADEPDPAFACISSLKALDLVENGVSTVIWATGFGGRFDWLRLPVLDSQGAPIHDRGIAQVPGIFFLGFPWLRCRKSGVIHGVEDDAEFLAAAIRRRAGAS